MATLPAHAVTFRGLPACPCQVTWIPAVERYLQVLGVLDDGEQLILAQLIGGFGGSGGTHGDKDAHGNITAGGGATDVWVTGAKADKVVAAGRQMGADASWHRPPNWDGDGGSEHDHLVLRGCPHLTQAAVAQIIAVDHNGDGLVGDAPDPGPRPLSKRTWRQGIEWARAQEEAMQETLDKILAAVNDLRGQVAQLRSAESDRAKATRKRDADIAEALDGLADQITTRAGKDQVRRLKTLLEQHDTETETGEVV